MKYNDTGSLWKDAYHSVYVDGTFTGGIVAAIQVSPDPLSTPDASSRWRTLQAFSAPGQYLDFSTKYRKLRVLFTTGGTGSPIIEVL